MKVRYLFFTELNNRLLMNVCIPCSGIHSRIGQRLTGERMDGLILKASGNHSRGGWGETCNENPGLMLHAYLGTSKREEK